MAARLFQLGRGIVMHSAHRVNRALLAILALVSALVSGDRALSHRRVFAFEPLEPRLPLSAAGLVDVGTQPDGGLSGKVVYIHGGHGYTADNLGNGAWSFQRGNLLGMVEDLGNVDQMTYLADYLFNAGATVVPLRPVGHQTNEFVIDNDDVEVTFVGNWSNSSATVYFGDVGDVPYRYASTSATETAYARYQPNIAEGGFYPVYAWTRSGSDRAEDQLYRVHHTGGITEVTANHRMVGNGLVYLGTYYFDAGTQGYVDVSNRSDDSGRVVIADMIRFGNGMGDIDRGGGVSGLAREDEAGLYWVMWHVDRSQGIPDSEYRETNNDRDATVSLSPRYAEYMNRESEGVLSDRLFVSFHSNAGSGSSRGVLGLYNGNNDPATATPNQFLLANTLGLEINNDLVAQAGMFEAGHNWFNRGTGVTLDRSDIEFGEINNLRINNEFDATIMEVGFHDNTLDAEMLRDPRVRDALARATYQGIVDYFRAVDGNATSIVRAPGVVTEPRAESNAAGSVTVSWQPSVANSYAGDAPTGYRIYASVDGYGFDGGTLVAGEITNTATLSGYDSNVPYYFKVVAVNEGGESPVSEVVVAVPSGGIRQVLVVNGFDRLDRSLDPTQTVSGSPASRVRPRESNSRDYVAQVGAAIQSAAPGVHVNSTSNEAVIAGTVNLTDYDTVIWILGEESTANDTFDAAEQTKVEQFIAGGGNLFLSGAEIGWDLDSQNNGRTFYEGTLLANYVSDDANSYQATGVAGRIFDGLSLAFDNGSLFYDVTFPDVIAAQPGSQLAMNYSGSANGAAIQAAGSGGRGSVVMLAFPFETITTAANRAAVIDRVFDFFALAPPPPPNADFNGDGTVDAADYTVWRDSSGSAVTPGEQQFGTSPGAGGAAEKPAAASADGGSAGLATPAGALTGKIVYTSAGHGWQWNSGLNRYATDRPDYNEIVEDFGNQDQLTYFADYLLRAGATVVPMRPVGHQLNEVVLDNDSPGVTYTGAWTDSASAVSYDEDYGAVVDGVKYRFASINASETAAATYTPNIPQAGFYPVYTWVADGANRTNQLYRITDSDGGLTEIRVDHRLVGKGWVYLGTYHFNAGSGGSVQVSNQSTAGGSVVIADAIRFGNGIGDYPDGPTPSGYPREDENSLQWLRRAIGQGNSASTVIGTSNVSAPTRMAEHMNAAPFGTSVYIGFHSNGTTGDPATATARGALGLIDSDQGTPNQTALATYVGRQINQDMQTLNGLFEHNWSTRTTHTLSSGFGEIDEGASAEMDMTIIEVGFHDNTQDSQLLRDPKVREQIGRSTYEAVLEYFDNFGGLTSPVSQPAKPINVRAIGSAIGDATVSWQSGPIGVQGGTPTGYRVYISRNGYGFSEYVDVAGAGTTSLVIPAAELDGDAYYFKVAAVNSGGESPGSALAGARKIGAGGENRVLVVDGFDRFDRTQNVRYPYAFTGDGLVDRVWARSNNSFDYVAQVGEAIEAYDQPIEFDFVQNETVIAGAVDLADYQAIVWLSGEESTANDTFNPTEQSLVTSYLNGGGKLFVSGAEIGYELESQGAGASFYNNTLMADYVADDGASYTTSGVNGTIFEGIALTFDDGTLFYDVSTPDRIAAIGGSVVAMNYTAPGSGGAAIQFAHPTNGSRIVNFGFPFETITTAANRAAVMDRVFDFFGLVVPPPNADFNGDGTVDAADFTVWRDSMGSVVTPGERGDADFDGQVDDVDYSIWKQQFGTSPGAGGAAGAGGGSGDSAGSSGAGTPAVHRSATDTMPQTKIIAGSLMTATEPRATVRSRPRASGRALDAAIEASDLLLVATGRLRRGRAFEESVVLRGIDPYDADLRTDALGVSPSQAEVEGIVRSIPRP
jgi:N-acetylmuramoyl-L-alanine amidase